MRSAAPLALALAALALAGCETSTEKSARLEKEALRAAAAKPAAHGLVIARRSSRVRVLGTALVRGKEGAAAVVTVRNASSTGLRDVPLAIDVKDAGGRSVYTNTTPGLAHSLVSIAYLPAHAVLSWVDDQVQGADARSVSAIVGDAPAAPGPAPRVVVSGVHQYDDPANGPSAEGQVRNRSAIAQQEPVVYVVARRGGRVTAAARAVLPLVEAHASDHFQAFFVGSAAGARLTVSVPPTVLR